MPDALTALRTSVDRLTGLVRPLDDDVLAGRAYPTEWSIADVLSHLGSGAVIAERRLSDTLAGRTTPADFSPTVWEEWNAKSPRAKADDAITAIDLFTTRLERTADEDRSRFKFAMGPLELDWNAFVGMRLNEHALHEWDVAVALNPTATLSDDVVAYVIDSLELIARFTGKPSGEPRSIAIRTVDPERSFAVSIETDSVTLSTANAIAEPDLSAPAEAFVRLVYGRLDPDHTPAAVVSDASVIDQLRSVFRGP